MPDVVDSNDWSRAKRNLEEIADELGAAFKHEKLPNGKEFVKVELWFRPKANHKE